MNTDDLSSYNFAELKGLLHDIDQEFKTRQKQELQKAREEILAIAQSAEISIESLLATVPLKQKKPAKKVLPQFQNPADRLLTWTGRGRPPRWVVEAEEKGVSRESLRIA